MVIIGTARRTDMIDVMISCGVPEMIDYSPLIIGR